MPSHNTVIMVLPSQRTEPTTYLMSSSKMNSSKTFTPSTKRGADTYQKVINAGISAIANHGFHNASTNKIAKSAGVTWGTLQHQFGDKARLLEAILEFCINDLISELNDSTSSSTPIEQRVDSLIEAIWHNQRTERSRAMQEILISVQTDDELRQRFSPTMEKLRDLYNAQWQQLFSDFDMSDDVREAIKQLTYSTLRGLASDLSLRSSDKAIQGAKAILKQTVTQLFKHKLYD